MPAGRPTQYKDEYAEQAYKLCLLRSKDLDLAGFFNVSEATVNVWKHKHPEFIESIRKGKEIADIEVAAALKHRAVGYSHDEDKIFMHNGKPVIVPTTKHYPPDTAAAFIWLKNRAGWKDKQTQEHIIDKDTATLLGLIDGSSKGQLPTEQEVEEAG